MELTLNSQFELSNDLKMTHIGLCPWNLFGDSAYIPVQSARKSITKNCDH